ncbi:unnamed protein product, partial [Polarella glacialis]
FQGTEHACKYSFTGAIILCTFPSEMKAKMPSFAPSYGRFLDPERLLSSGRLATLHEDSTDGGSCHSDAEASSASDSASTVLVSPALNKGPGQVLQRASVQQ